MRIEIKEKSNELILLGNIDSKKVIICYGIAEDLMQDTAINKLAKEYLIVLSKSQIPGSFNDLFFIKRMLEKLDVLSDEKTIDTLGIGNYSALAVNSYLINGKIYLVGPVVNKEEEDEMKAWNDNNAETHVFIGQEDDSIESLMSIKDKFETLDIFKNGKSQWNHEENNLISLTNKMINKILEN